MKPKFTGKQTISTMDIGINETYRNRSMEFSEARDSFDYAIREALRGRYEFTRAGLGYSDEVIYRDPETKEILLLEGSGKGIDATVKIKSPNLDRTMDILLKQLFKKVEGEVQINLRNIGENLEDLSQDAHRSGHIYWDPQTKGLIKRSYGGDVFIPAFDIETTQELCVGEVCKYIIDFLNQKKGDITHKLHEISEKGRKKRIEMGYDFSNQ